ncbi:Ump1 protein [Saccharomycopsis crataegensis]|uniref:Ump1 protein n=1 Tax=Saccharomycopsis crataegensis TaxID=43959 RepID=A0AAV5QK13_9ASCO|nr:Ump1 protein [Saccharomycopsis crataegensis]
MSMRLIPKSDFQSEVNATKFETSAVHVDLPDTLRAGKGPLSIASQVNGHHPLEQRLANWEETQHSRKLEQYKRMFGAAEPIRRVMELQIVEKTDFKPAVLTDGSRSLHQDVLLGKEMSVDWEDVYTNIDEENPRDFHTDLERKVGI